VSSSLHVVVDGANVVGSRPDGWWHDRPGAARRLAGQLVAALAEDPAGLGAALTGTSGRSPLVHLVLEGAAARVPDLPTHPHLDVVLAAADGDSTIAALADDLVGETEDGDVLVVTADRELRDRVRAAGARTVGPGVLLGALPGG
jgi:hypothetical protein